MKHFNFCRLRSFISIFYVVCLGAVLLICLSVQGGSRSKAEAKDLSDSLDRMLEKVKTALGQKDIDLTLGVVKDGKIFLKKNYGYSNPETKTLFSDKTNIYIASTTKSFTGTLAAVLNGKGLIKLDKTIADYLPGFSFDDKRLDPAKITMQSLLTHTHGIKSNDAVVWTAFIGIKNTEQVLALVRKYSTALPNKNFNYSNLGPVLYSLIVEKVLGRPWQDVMADEVFKPLKMRSTTCYVSKADKNKISFVIDEVDDAEHGVWDKEDNSMSAAGGALTTVNDLLKYLQFFMSKGATTPGLLDKAAVEFATSGVVAQKTRYQSYQRYGYGLGWEQSVFNGEQLVSRMGGYSGISSHLSYLRDKNIGIVVLSNKKGMEALPHLVANYIYNTLLGKANKEQLLNENLTLFRRYLKEDETEKAELAAAKKNQLPFNAAFIGHYDGGDKSGTMDIDKDMGISWGNLHGRLYVLSDTSGLINFSTMVRSAAFKRDQGKLTGIYSNERLFIKQQK